MGVWIMDCMVNFFELTITVDKEDFQKHLDRANKNAKKSGWVCLVDAGYADRSLQSDGIAILYADNTKKKKIKVIVCPSIVINDDNDSPKYSKSNILRLIGRLDKIISSYFNSDYELNDFKLNQIDFGIDIKINNQDKVSDYIKVLHSIGRVKCFSPAKYDKKGEMNKDNCFMLIGKTNGIEFKTYGYKEKKRYLRVEVRLTKKETIQAYSNDGDTTDQIQTLIKGSGHILMDTFQYIVPRGD
jgi:hypothetical protein